MIPVFRFYGLVEEPLLERFRAFSIRHAGVPRVRVLFDSPGGYATVAHPMVSRMHHMRAHGSVVEAVMVGEVCSAAVAVWAAASRGHRYMPADGRLMVHEGVLTLTDKVTGVERTCRVSEVQEWGRCGSLIALLDWVIYLGNLERGTGTPQHEWKNLIKDGHDVWLDPEQARGLGLVDQMGCPPGFDLVAARHARRWLKKYKAAQTPPEARELQRA